MERKEEEFYGIIMQHYDKFIHGTCSSKDQYEKAIEFWKAKKYRLVDKSDGNNLKRGYRIIIGFVGKTFDEVKGEIEMRSAELNQELSDIL